MKTGAKKVFPFWESWTAEPGGAVADEDLWGKAKTAALKTYGQDDPAYWPVVMSIYKKMGGTISKQADGGASFPQVIRAHESDKLPSPSSFRFRESTTFLEAATSSTDASPDANRFDAIVIQEGMGNFGTRFYYTREALESAVKAFEGKKIYADHPTEEEEQIRPERSVRDVLGYHQNVRVKEDKDGHAILLSEVSILKSKDCDWARERMREAIEYSKKYPDQDFVGLSINAQGEAEEWGLEDFMESKDVPAYCREKLIKAKEEGITEIRVVSKFINAISCDLVTEAGAGGRVTKMIEGEKMPKTKKKKTTEADQKHPAAGKGPTDKVAKEADDHEDVEKDKTLIQSMLKKHLGKDGEEYEADEADVKLATECMGMAKKEGLEGEEAEAEAMKAMKHIKAYGAMKQTEAKESEETEESEETTEAEETEESDEAEETEEAGAKESKITKLEQENLKLRGVVALQEKKQRKVDLASYLDKKLSESGEDRKTTNIFREAINLDEVKNSKEIDSKWTNFLEGYRVGRQSVGFDDVFVNVEKKGEPDKSGLDLADCFG